MWYRGTALLLGWLAMLLSCVMAQRTQHQFKLLTSQRVRSIMRCNNIESLQQYDFPSILHERVPGTEGHDRVKEYILSRLGQLNCSRWNITQHSFEDRTPYGNKPFTNIIATLDPGVDKRLVLAAHYDSKLIPNFLGATDSALAVALLLDLALTLDEKLAERDMSSYSLQLIFTDGEEAFRQWSSTDSIYGARRLATDMAQEGGLFSVGDKTGIEAIEAFVLFDLIGSTIPYPSFHDMFSSTTSLFQRIVKIEKRLKDMGHLESHPQQYFKARTAHGLYNIGDDHVPFHEKGVPVVHLITNPFPSVWHTTRDNAKAIDWTFVSNFRKVMMVFLHEYFHLH